MTTMTHMEGNFTDDRNQQVFLLHVRQLRAGMDLASEYGAVLTIESEQPFARANTIWNLNMMAEIRDRGFGVGTHCDFGFKDGLMPVEEFAANFRANKQLVDALVGAENNLGCSGGGSANDWAQAAGLAGFKYVDGIVSMHYLSMPLENRPGPVWTDAYILSGNHHFNAPVDMLQRIYLVGLADAKDFLPDPNPVIVASSGEFGAISDLAEGTHEAGAQTKAGKTAVFDQADADSLAATILTLNAARDKTRIAKITVYIPASMFAAEYEAAFRYFYDKMEQLQKQGIIQWATQKQVYEAYAARN
jgi:hypothetical protein